MKKAYAYLRVSSPEQAKDNKDGFARQKETIMQSAKTHGYRIIKIFEEKGVSGTLLDRPSLASLLVELEINGNGIKTVFVEKVDRLARDLMVQETIIADFQKSGYCLISALEGAKLLSDDPSRKLIRQVFGAIAEYDKSMLVLKLRAARDRKRLKNGKCEGRKGYKEINPELVQQAKRLYRKNPKTGKRRSLLNISHELFDLGFTTKKETQFSASQIKRLVS